MIECGNALLQKGYKLKIFNTINFSKSMKYNPMAYIHSEKDILKLVTALMTNTKGEGQGGDPFWDKAERLLLVSLIAYLHYEAPVEEQNFATLLEMLNTICILFFLHWNHHFFDKIRSHHFPTAIRLGFLMLFQHILHL